MSDGFVYFIQEEETGRIKIGFSEKHPKGRLKEFQTGNSNKLNLIGFIEGTYQDETNLHNEFSEERIRESNEWFKSSPRLGKRIKDLLEESLEDNQKGLKFLSIKTTNYKSGDKYEGEHKDGIRHGQGTYTWPSGQKHEGEWKDGKQNGQGTCTLSSGQKYEGEWKDGKKHGKGTDFFEDGSVKYVGNWKDGEYHGLGTCYLDSFFSDLRGGIKIYGDGEWKEGKMYNGKINTAGSWYRHLINGKEVSTFSEEKSLFAKFLDAIK